jgi:hypothetical protein
VHVHTSIFRAPVTYTHTDTRTLSCPTHCIHYPEGLRDYFSRFLLSPPSLEASLPTTASPPHTTMATLNTSSNGPNITRSYQNVVNAPAPSGTQASSPTYGQWAVFTVAAPLVSAFQQDGGKESVLKVQSTGGM